MEVPVTGPGPGLTDRLVAPVTDHASVADWPATIVVGAALNARICGGLATGGVTGGTGGGDDPPPPELPPPPHPARKTQARRIAPEAVIRRAIIGLVIGVLSQRQTPTPFEGSRRTIES
jgi:hypothetical protein